MDAIAAIVVTIIGSALAAIGFLLKFQRAVSSDIQDVRKELIETQESHGQQLTKACTDLAFLEGQMDGVQETQKSQNASIIRAHQRLDKLVGKKP